MSLPSAIVRLALRGEGLELVGLDDFAQADALALAIRDLDSDYRLARHRRLDSHRRGSQSHREVVGQVHDLAHLDSRAGLELVHRDHRPGLNLRDPPEHAEVAEFLFEHGRAPFEQSLVDLGVLGGRAFEQVQ